MSYQVIARKWRPQDFGEIVYQDHISRTLKNSIKSGRISHAYLFSGPRGVGKTTMARVLAKALNCVEGPTDSPCGVCRNCREIREGISFDVIEIDGASNRGIENIRELRENVNFAPVKSRYKVYIVDEVHMLTEPAFNALLKTLEEPPPHVVFVFATTEYHKIPETILSRCQKYFFKKLSIESIVKHLVLIAEKEGFKIEEKAIFSIARAAEGSMRDAQSLLDQILSFSEGEVREHDALVLLGVVPVESYIDLLGYVADGDKTGLIKEIHRVEELGIDLARYFAGLMNCVRSIRLVRNGVIVREILEYSDEEAAALGNIADRFHDDELSGIFRIGSGLQNELRFIPNERIAIEMALLDMAAIKSSPSLASIIRKLENAASPDASENTEKKKLKTPPPVVTHQPEKKETESGPRTPANASSAGSPPVSTLPACWKELMSSIQHSRQYLYFKLNEARVRFTGDQVILSYEQTGDNGYYSGILDKKDIGFIKDELKKRTGRPVSLKIESSTPEIPVEAIVENGDVPLPEAEMVKNPEVEELDLVNPVVEKIKDMFHGQIVDKGDK